MPFFGASKASLEFRHRLGRGKAVARRGSARCPGYPAHPMLSFAGAAGVQRRSLSRESDRMSEKPPERRRSNIKAYLKESFLTSSDARPLRILAEYLEPRSRFDRYKID